MENELRRPLKEGKKELIPIPETNEAVEVEFVINDMVNVNETEKKQLEQLMRDFLAKGYAYIIQTVGENIPISRKLLVEFTKKSGHRHQGTLMEVSIDHMRSVQTSDDPKIKELQQSLIIHEVLHNLDDAETFPMFIEIIYMLEQGQSWRIDKYAELKADGKFGPAYLKGLKQIAEWLNYSDIDELLQDIVNRDIVELKSIFKKQITLYCESDEILNKQMKIKAV